MGKSLIYLVEDDALTARAIRQQLTRAGYEICGQATTGEQALQEIPARRPDLVVMDIELAGKLTGVETANQLRTHLDLPVVYLSIHSDPKVVEAAVGTGPFGYLIKPFEERELHATIQAALYKHRVEKLLREDVRRQAALLQRTGEIAGIGGWELALPSQELTWSAEVYRLHELPPHRPLTLEGALAFYTPESRRTLEAAGREAIQNGTPFNVELALVTATGRPRWVRAQAEAEREAGQVVRLIGSFQDITGHKEMVEALRRSETRFRTLYDTTSDAVMVLGEQRFLDCNPATLAIFGCASREEFCSKHPADLSPPRQPCGTDSLTLANQRIATALQTGSYAFEWLHRRVDNGQPFPAEVLLTAMQLDGRPVLQGVVRDITGRKRREAAERQLNAQLLQFQSTLLALRNHEGGDLTGFLRLATEQISRALDVERVGIWFFDDAREAIVCRDLFQRTSGKHDAGLRFVAADFPAYFQAFTTSAAVLADDACSHPDTCEFAEGYLKPNGITSMLDAPLRLGSDIAGVLCCEQTQALRHWTPEEEKFAVSAAATILLMRDHERRRMAEVALKESEARLQNLANAANEAIFFHENGIIYDANPESCRMFGYRLDELVGRSGFTLLAPELHEKLRPNLSSGENLRYEAIGLRKDGSRFPVEISARNSRPQSRSLRVVCVRDLTAVQQAITQLRDRETLLSSINTHLPGSAVFRLLLSPDGRMRCSYVTPNVGPFLGVEPEEFLARPDLIFSRVVPEDLPRIQAANRRAFETGEDGTFTFRILSPDGQIRWFHYRARQIERLPDGTQVRDAIATDITAIKEAEAEVRRQAEFLDALHQTTLDLLNRLEQRDLMQAIVERAAALFAAPICELLLKERDELVVETLTRDEPSRRGRRLTREDAPLSWQAHDTSRPVLVENYLTHPDRCQNYDPLALQAVAEFPILHHDTCLGVLSLGRTAPHHPFSPEEIQRGKIMAKQVALALHNASIHADAVQATEQRTLELRESEEHYRSVVETSPAAIVVADFQWRVLTVNPRALEIFGSENNPPFLGRSVFDWVPPAEVARLQALLSRLMQAGALRGVPAVLHGQDDRPFEALLDGAIIKDATGQPKSLMLMIQDVTEQRRAARALAESEEKYRGLVTSVNDGVFAVDAPGRITFANPALVRLLGWEHPEQIVGRSILEFIAPAMLEEVSGDFRHALETGRTREATVVELRRPDGTSAVAEIKSVIVREGNRVVGMKGTIRDTTEHRRAEQALKLAHRRTLVLAQLGRELAEAATPRLAGLAILRAARQLIDWDCAWLHLWNEHQQQFEDLATFDLVGGKTLEMPQTKTPLGEVSPMMRRVMQDGPQLLLRHRETEQTNDLKPIANARRSLSLMFVPLRLTSRFIGVLSIQSYQRQAYDQAALELLQTLADHCAGAMSRMQAISALAVSEERFRLVWENATDGMRLTDAEGRIVAANTAFCRMMGRSRGDLEGQLLSILYAEPENQNLLARHRERFARHDLLTNLEVQLTLADGRVLWQEVSHCFIETDPARPLLLGVYRDITGRKLTENALRLLSSGLANLSGESFFQEVARQLTRLLGLEIGFIGKLLGGEPARIRTLGLCMDGVMQPDMEYAIAGTPCAKVISKQTACHPDQVAGLFPDDRLLSDLRVASYVAIPLTDQAGHAIGHVGVMSRQPLANPHRVEAILQIFAVRVAAEIERQRAERRFHDLFEFSPDAIIMANQEGRIMMANLQAEKLFGYAHDELLGQVIENLVPAANRPEHAEFRLGFHGTARPRSMAAGNLDLRGVRKDGTEFPVDISLNPLESDTGTWVAAAIRDLSELRRAQQQTLRAQRLESIGRLAGGVAHDLNNALAPIVIAVEMLHEKYPNSTELIDRMSSSAHRAAAMVKQLLTFARGVEGARSIIEPLLLLKDMEKLIKGTFPKDIQLRTDYAPNLQSVRGDATQLHQVLLNLCVNARDAMPQGGMLTLTAQNADVDPETACSFPEAKPGRHVVWRVADTGPGIPPEILERIFEPFFSTKGPTKGTGLGLSTATGIVKSHGGFIRVFSPSTIEPPGFPGSFGVVAPTNPHHGPGATFEVYLPVSESNPASPTPASARG